MKTKELYDKYMITGMVDGFEPLEVAWAKGTHITDKSGKTYLDCFSGIAVTNIGHNHPQVLAAAKTQMDRFIHCGTYVYYNPQAGLLAQKLASITPGNLTKSFFGNSGAEAVEGALRIARSYSGKREFIALMQGFHGRTLGTLSVTGNRGRKKRNGPYAPGVAFIPAPYSYRCPFGSRNDKECAARSAEFLRETLRFSTSGDVAAIIAEGVMGEGGIIVPHPDYFKYIRQILKEEEILFIADEVQSGFGRTGRMFAIEHSGVEPDILCMAKSIAGGLPLSAFIVRNEIAKAFKPGDHLSTFGGNPVSCAAALATIQVLQKEKLLENARVKGNQILSFFKEMQNHSLILGEARGLGLMIGLELVENKKTKTPAAKKAQIARTLARKAGLLIGIGGSYGNVLRLQPPLTLSESEADRICESLKKILLKIE